MPPAALSLSWSGQILSALSFLHERGAPIVHRDVKPSNIFVSSDLASVRLGDFGTARAVPIQKMRLAVKGDEERPHLGSGNQSQHSRDMSSMTGTFIYMAPEVRLEFMDLCVVQTSPV